MLHLNTLRTQTFHPAKLDDSIEPPRKVVQLFADDIELSNSVEHANWSIDPVIPHVCDLCWHAECGATGIAHIVRTHTQLLWMPPYSISQNWPLWNKWDPPNYRCISDAYLLTGHDWERVRTEVGHIPEFESFPVITNHVLFHLWLQQRPNFAVQSPHETFRHHLRHHVIASDLLDVDVALAAIASLEDELAKPPIPQSGSFVPVSEITDEFNSLYFDGDGLQEFVTFTAAAPHRLVIGGQYVLLP